MLLHTRTNKLLSCRGGGTRPPPLFAQKKGTWKPDKSESDSETSLVSELGTDQDNEPDVDVSDE